MKSFINDLNKMVNTAQKIDKLLTEKPKRPRFKPKSVFNDHLRGLIEYILSQPLENRKSLEKEIIDNINELHYQNNY